MALSDGEHSTLDELWSCFSSAAALCQAVRTAAQKRLNEPVSALGTTYVRRPSACPSRRLPSCRVVVGRPRVPDFSPAFLFAASCGAAVQVASTSLLIELFRKRGFAAALLTVVIGVVCRSLD